VYSRGWPASRCRSHLQRRDADELSPLAVAPDFLGAWRMIQDYVISPRVMGQKHGAASVGRHLRRAGRGEIAGVRASIFRFHHGQPADRMATMAPLRREETVRFLLTNIPSAPRSLPRHSDYSGQPRAAVTTWSVVNWQRLTLTLIGYLFRLRRRARPIGVVKFKKPL